MQGIDIRLRWSCPRANGGGDAYRDEDAHFARRQAFGLDDIDSSTHYVEHAAKTLFLMWVTLTEHKWVTLGERRGRMIVQNDSNGAADRVVSVEILEQSDEFPAAMPPLNTSCDMTLVKIQRRQDR